MAEQKKYEQESNALSIIERVATGEKGKNECNRSDFQVLSEYIAVLRLQQEKIQDSIKEELKEKSKKKGFDWDKFFTELDEDVANETNKLNSTPEYDEYKEVVVKINSAEKAVTDCVIIDESPRTSGSGQEKVKYTKEGFQKLFEELYVLKIIKREEIKDALKAARDLGDLSENSEYDEARTQQGMNEARIAELEELVKGGFIYTENDGSVVSIGSTVAIRHKDGREKKYDIVGSNEVDPLKGKISDLSPIGSALIGHEIGDVVYIYTPAGEKEVTVVSVERTKK